jgi:GT2 family glycosyltransferase
VTISIIIVNYNAAQLIIDSLQSFLPGSMIGPEIIIVDNGSGENDLNLISQAFPQVKIIRMNYNAGFARANNEGIRQSAGDIVLLLNPDTLAPDNAIEKCFHAFSASDYVACGVQLLNPDGTPQISGNYFMKGALNNLLPLPYTGSFIKWVGEQLKVQKPNIPDTDKLVEVDWINGAFLMVKKTAIQKAGLLDEDFFLYAEEIEWCSRLRKTGQLCIFGDIKLIHLQGETANISFGSSGKGYYNLFDRKGLQILVSNFLRIRKQYGIGWYLFHLFIYLLEIPVLFLGIIVERISGKKVYPFHILKGYTSNILKLISLTPRIMRNRPHFYKML